MSLILWGLILGITCFLCIASKGRFLTTGPVQSFSNKLWLTTGQLASHRWLSVTVIVGIVLLFRLGALPVLGQPYGRSHDEFSYILAGQTFALGRLTNPTPPLWKFFETEHILVVPSYMSKYPPVQGFFIALGLLFGNAWFGILLSYVLMFAAIYWASLAFLPARYAILAGLIPAIHPGVSSYWVNSYFGGAATAIGGALVSGACGRLLLRVKPLALCAMVLGLYILANTRPYEGATFSAAAFLVVLLIRWRAGRSVVKDVAKNCLLPGLLALFLLGAMLYYNYRLTGNALLLPYVEWQRQYSPIPLFFFSKMTPFPHYNSPILQANYTVVDRLIYEDSLTVAGFLKAIIHDRIAGTENFFIGITLLPMAVAAILFASRDRKMAPLWVGTIVMSVAICITAVGFQRHYPAPATAAYAILMVQGLRHLRHLKWRQVLVGTALSRVVLLGCVVGIVCGFTTFPAQNRNMQASQDEFPRREILRKLEAIPGKHLVIVHYAKGHDPHREYVVNEPDLDKARIVWAREFDAAENQKLIDRFKDRTVWVFDPDHVEADHKVEPKLFTWQESLHTELSKVVDDSNWNHLPQY